MLSNESLVYYSIMSSPSQSERNFNSTAAGQMKMFYSAGTKSTVFLLNKKVRELGGQAWDDKMIETANEFNLNAIREDLIACYNELVQK